MHVRWLQLADLHLGYDRMIGDDWVADTLDAHPVVPSLLQAVATEAGTRPLDMILLTGDIVEAGQLEEYELARGFVERLWAASGLDASRTWLVPGNHDLDRHAIRRSHLRTLYRFEEQQDISEVLADPDLLAVLMAKFGHFQDFAEFAMGRRHFDARTWHMVEALHLDKGGHTVKVNLLGLNSCLFAGYDGDADGRLALSRRQAETALEQRAGDAVFSIGFLHHPVTCLSEVDERSGRRLVSQLDLLLHGSAHRAEAPALSTAPGQAVVVGAGRCTRGGALRFSTGEVDLGTGRGVIRRFRLDGDQGWALDPETADGGFAFEVAGLRSHPLRPRAVQAVAEEPADQTAPYDVFISYDRSDAAFVSGTLRPLLDACAKPDGGRPRIFHDIDSLRGGDNWRRAIARAIESCGRFLAVYSPAFFQSEVCEWELGLARSRDLSARDGLVVPVMARGDEGIVPFELRGLNWIRTGVQDLDQRLYRALGLAPAHNGGAEFSAELPQAPGPPTRVHFIHPYTLPDSFTGRSTERARLRGIVAGRPDPETGRAVRVATVRAIGGMGKSCLVRKVVEELRGASRFHHVVWFSFYEAKTEDPGAFFRDVLRALGDDPGPAPQPGRAEVVRLQRLLCQRLDQAPVLLVLDGLEVIQRDAPDQPGHGQLKETHQPVATLLAHLCNGRRSAALVTSRVTLSRFQGTTGYVELGLDVMDPVVGAELLERMGVCGSEDELRSCARVLGGHPLVVAAAARRMVRRRIPAGRIQVVVGDPRVFEASPDGERLAKIVESYRGELDEAQRRFLQGLAVHPRAVGAGQFAALVEGCGEGWPEERVWDEIAWPLEERGLIEIADLAGGARSCSAHPLMKVAFSAWFDAEGQRRAHRAWADAAARDPRVRGSATEATSREEIQPWLDAVEHYQGAGMWAEAWRVWERRGVDRQLAHLGCARELWELGRRFEGAADRGHWTAQPRDLGNLFEYLAQAAEALEYYSAELSYLEMCAAVRKAAGSSYTHSFSVHLVVQELATQGRPKEATRLFESHTAQSGDVSGSRDSYQNLSQACISLAAGRYREAIDTQQVHWPGIPWNSAEGLYERAEAKWRIGDLDGADHDLGRARDLCQRHHMTGLFPRVLLRRTWLELSRADLQAARAAELERLEACAGSGLPHEPSAFLLANDGRGDEAIRVATEALERLGPRALHIADTIQTLIAHAQAHAHTGDLPAARTDLDRARTLADEHGCWRERNRFEETEALLAPLSP